MKLFCPFILVRVLGTAQPPTFSPPPATLGGGNRCNDAMNHKLFDAILQQTTYYDTDTRQRATIPQRKQIQITQSHSHLPALRFLLQICCRQFFSDETRIMKTSDEGSDAKLTLENETSTTDLVRGKVSEPIGGEYANAEDDGLWFSDGIRNQNCMSRIINSCSGDSSRHHTSNRQRTSGMKETEDFLAAEMNKLTMEERSKALDDVHCVGEDVQENPEEIERLLQEYQTVVEKSKNECYDLAFAKNPDFVQDIAFRLMFLRANLYNVKSAVKQMFRFLEQKMTYFGEEILARKIALSDLNAEDIEAILAGVVVLQKERDSSGRCVLYSFNHVLFGKFDVKAIVSTTLSLIN